MTTNPLLDAALAYAGCGWHVFPCASGAKEPAIPGGGGHRDATTDPEKIKAWWSIFPDANIGCHLAASGLMAIDIDLYKPTCQWPAFSQGLDIPPTFTQRTPRGGWHLVYTVTPGEEFPGKLCEGVEIKHHGYILLAPSRFEGAAYVWQ